MADKSFKVKNGIQIGTSTEVTSIVDEDNMASNSATALSTQQSIKAYVDSQTSAAGVLTVIDDSSIDNVISIATKDTISKDVFKKVSRTKKSPISGDKRKRKRRGEKKGGGRQKMEKKLNRQRILEFKYFAREELDNPNIPEEQRSNILGQIIAKGERISIDSAIEFIQSKQAELILTEEVANSLVNEIRRISTRR